MDELSYEGYFDQCDNNIISGWVFNKDDPDSTIYVDVYFSEILISTIPANIYRNDLAYAEKGNGYHAFKFVIPDDLKNGLEYLISVKVSNTNIHLTQSPKNVKLNRPEIILMEESKWIRTGDLVDELVTISNKPTVQASKPKSPLLGNLFTFNPDSILTTCCNSGGGLYLINFSERSYEQKKIMDGDFRGIGRYKDLYLIASNSHGILLLNNEFKILKAIASSYMLDYHGVAIHGDKAYVVETKRNTIAIFDLPDLERTGEIRLSLKEIDIFHINDIYVDNNTIYLSMFSDYGEWRKSSVYSGVIIAFPLDNIELSAVLHKNLKHPHSITVYGNKLVYCNSSNFEVKENDKVIYKGTGYTRGLALQNDIIYIGQSESRNVEDVRDEILNVSLDCGVIVFNRKEKISRFISLPSEEIYGIIVL